MDKMFKKLCTPAQIYFGIAVIASIVALFRGVTFGKVFMNLIFAFVWTYILGWLCKKGFSAISWFLVLLPYIVLILAMLRIARIDQHRAIFKSVGLQGAYGEEPFEMPKMSGEEEKKMKEGLKVRRRP
jgi:hypothetical protein